MAAIYDSVGDLIARIQSGLRRRFGRASLRSQPDLERLHQRFHHLDVAGITAAPIQDARFVVVDTETTGFHAYAGDEIISVALLELRGTVPTGRSYHTLVNPGRPIPAASSQIHGIADADVAGSPSLEQVLAEVLAFIDDGVLVGHHINFDLRFLNKTMQRKLLCRLRNPWVDTMLLYIAATGRMGHYTLEEVATFCKVPVVERHTARGDAHTAAGIFTRLCGRLVPPDRPVRDLIEVQFDAGDGLAGTVRL